MEIFKINLFDHVSFLFYYLSITSIYILAKLLAAWAVRAVSSGTLPSDLSSKPGTFFISKT